jgi:tetratricopeptide (TPR) repeat protein
VLTLSPWHAQAVSDPLATFQWLVRYGVLIEPQAQGEYDLDYAIHETIRLLELTADGGSSAQSDELMNRERQALGHFVAHRAAALADSLKFDAAALGLCDRALRLDPDFSGAWFTRCVVLKRLGRTAESLEANTRVLDLDRKSMAQPDPAMLCIRVELLSDLDRHQEALDLSMRFLQTNPNDFRMWYVQALSLYALNNYAGSLMAVDRALAVQPYDSVGWNCKGMALFMLRRF